MNEVMHKFEEKIHDRERQGNLRKLHTRQLPYDFVSNDYLGLGRSQALSDRIQDRFHDLDLVKKNGSTGSRLLSGNSELAANVENQLAQYFNAEAALIFNSGYTANLSIVSSIAGKGDLILYDQLSHVCLKEGGWLSRADSQPFNHNDLVELERKLHNASSYEEVFVVIETIYSMDGDFAPVQEIIDLCDRFGANLIVDEAHSTGVMGDRGSGYLRKLGVEDKVFARVYTFGKAMGVHGACICGSDTLIKYLINFARPFVYTTAMPPHSLVSIEQSFEYLRENPELVTQLNHKIDLFRDQINQWGLNEADMTYPGSSTAIQPIIIPGNDRIKEIAERLQEDGFDVRPILAPTVKQGSERLRISLHVHNTDEEIIQLVSRLKALV